MATWTSFTSRAMGYEGDPVIVNVDLIETVAPHELGACIYMSSGKLVAVNESAADAFIKIAQASGIPPVEGARA
ncbi:hypothetical protein DRW48_10485 [Paracoccus suum]|uniref:Uncharacterized protein n=1 Tax=Paracoccus suum TaxID=2259340 RepID=A0A344PL06_9RHOB|nr:hypothetical protein [Paracoccus suum]AXC50061.1 hypothetical protein DRW48_10485 [Paracoccus suum]